LATEKNEENEQKCEGTTLHDEMRGCQENLRGRMAGGEVRCVSVQMVGEVGWKGKGQYWKGDLKGEGRRGKGEGRRKKGEGKGT
jgi:hypothetical protein